MNNIYAEYREKIRDGDLLIWDKGTGGLLNKIYAWFIQTFERSGYVHIAVASVDGDRIVFVEAAPPEIQISVLSNNLPFLHVPMNIEWKEEYNDILKSRLGEKYSRLEAIRSYFTSPKKDKVWQCAEFVRWFYTEIGLDAEFGYTPKSVITAAQELTGNGVFRIGS